ncbi:MAG: DUF2283 domain-containing protein [Candidatus Omnitrophota bacterium]
MGAQRVEQKTIEQIVAATPYLLKFPYRKMWIDYAKEADVLYINFKRPQKATDSEMTKNGILLRYKGKELVGMTILDASQRGMKDI